MDLKECYNALEGDYDGVIARLRSERLVKKFTLKFLGDDSYRLLHDSLENENYQEAFRAAHTLKGVCQNLNFTKLYESSHLLTEALRNGWSDEAALLVPRVDADYKQTVDAIKELDG